MVSSNALIKMQNDDIEAMYRRSIRNMFTAARMIKDTLLRQYAKRYVSFLLGSCSQPSFPNVGTQAVQKSLTSLNLKRLVALKAKLDLQKC